MNECKYQEANLIDLNRRWDKNIANNPGDDRWVTWKHEFIKNNRNNTCKTFVVLYNGEPIGEGTLILSRIALR